MVTPKFSAALIQKLKFSMINLRDRRFGTVVSSSAQLQSLFWDVSSPTKAAALAPDRKYPFRVASKGSLDPAWEEFELKKLLHLPFNPSFRSIPQDPLHQSAVSSPESQRVGGILKGESMVAKKPPSYTLSYNLGVVQRFYNYMSNSSRRKLKYFLL